MSRGIDGTFLNFTITTRRRANIGTPLSTPLPPKTGAKKVREIAALKMEYIVVMATALYDRCYFESSVFLWRISPAPTLSKRCSTRRTNAA